MATNTATPSTIPSTVRPDRTTCLRRYGQLISANSRIRDFPPLLCPGGRMELEGFPYEIGLAAFPPVGGDHHRHRGCRRSRHLRATNLGGRLRTYASAICDERHLQRRIQLLPCAVRKQPS